ncbi:hypothetical protein ACFL0V_06675, partial [Nanoarchaeota archaeon]
NNINQWLLLIDMRWTIFPLLMLLLGCASPSSVYISNLSTSEDFDESINSSVTKLSFLVNNPSDSIKDCRVILKIIVSDNTTTKVGRLKPLEPKESRPADFDITIPEGESSIDLDPVCQ